MTSKTPVHLSLNHLVELKKHLTQVYIEETVLNYILELVRTSRSLPQLSHGVSVRGGLHFLSATRALAFLRGRDFVTPIEVQDLAIPALAHRLCFKDGTENYEAKCQVIQQLLKQVPAPR
jgi:MoxR-like ATPase